MKLTQSQKQADDAMVDLMGDGVKLQDMLQAVRGLVKDYAETCELKDELELMDAYNMIGQAILKINLVG